MSNISSIKSVVNRGITFDTALQGLKWADLMEKKELDREESRWVKTLRRDFERARKFWERV